VTDHPFNALPDRGKEPTSKRNLDAWIEQAQPKTGVASGRLGWLVASSVVIAALQRTRADDGHPRFLLKGGAYLEVRLGLRARATKDIDTLFRGDFGDFLEVLDGTLAESWGAIELQRTEVAIIEGARRVVKPRRFKVKLLINGQTWRSIVVEVAADEGQAGANVDLFAGPPLRHFGLPSPVELAGIVFDYQVAQKVHACTDPHEPPDQINDRARDLVDLLLIRDFFYRDDTDLVAGTPATREGTPPCCALRAACVDVFDARAQDAEALGLTVRTWPPTVHAHADWQTDFADAAGDRELTLDAAVDHVNEWIRQIHAASTP